MDSVEQRLFGWQRPLAQVKPEAPAPIGRILSSIVSLGRGEKAGGSDFGRQDAVHAARHSDATAETARYSRIKELHCTPSDIGGSQNFVRPRHSLEPWRLSTWV